MKITILFFIAVILSACSIVKDEPYYLSPSLLIASMNKYDGEYVKVRGWLRSEFENYSLWESREANEHGSFMHDCVSLLIPESMDTSIYNQKYVEVEGVFLKRLPSNVINLGGCNIPTIQLFVGSAPTLIKSKGQTP